MSTEFDEANRMAALSDDELREEVEKILQQIDADERRAKRLRWLVIMMALMVAWCLGASCALNAVPK